MGERTDEQHAQSIDEQMARQIELRRQNQPDRRKQRVAPERERRRICTYCFQSGDHPTPAHCLRALER